MFTQEDRNYVHELLIDRQAKLFHALHSSNPQFVSKPDPHSVQLEIDQVTAVLDKISKIQSK
jgi:hypothetical protein